MFNSLALHSSQSFFAQSFRGLPFSQLVASPRNFTMGAASSTSRTLGTSLMLATVMSACILPPLTSTIAHSTSDVLAQPLYEVSSSSDDGEDALTGTSTLFSVFHPSEIRVLPPKVALILAGSFNPVTAAHGEIALAARQYLHNNGVDVTHILFSPVSDAYYKPELIHASHRVQMCHILCQHLAEKYPEIQFISSDFEARQKHALRTLEVLQHLENTHNVHCAALVGADVVLSMKNRRIWNREQVRRIVGRHHLIVVPRPDLVSEEELRKIVDTEPVFSDIRQNIHIIDTDLSHLSLISSTAARAAARKGENEQLDSLLSPPVASFVKQKGLYGYKIDSKV